jgi:hypothetical protein
MMPQEVGFAAAYEAYRQIKYSSNVYNNLYTDYERQHEALRGLAIAEGLSLSISILPLSLTPHVVYHLTKPRACGRTRVVEWTNMAYRWCAMLLRRQPVK